MPGLLVEAQRRAQGESDNISVVAMTWENQDDARVADTAERSTTSSSRPRPTPPQQLDIPGGPPTT